MLIEEAFSLGIADTFLCNGALERYLSCKQFRKGLQLYARMLQRTRMNYAPTPTPHSRVLCRRPPPK